MGEGDMDLQSKLAEHERKKKRITWVAWELSRF